MEIKIQTFKTDNVRNQMQNLFFVLKSLNNLNDNNITFNLSKVESMPPVLILPLKCLINILKKSKKINFVIENQKINDFLKDIYFYDRLNISNDKELLQIFKNYYDKTYMPIINFSTNKNDYKVTNEIISNINNMITHQLKISADYRNGIIYVIDELINNIFDHANVNNAWIYTQHFEKNNYLDLCIIDTGITMFGSYKKNAIMDVSNDAEAIKYALNGISTKKEKGRGFGIRTSRNLTIKGLKGIFVVYSGNGFFYNAFEGSTEKLILLPNYYRWEGTFIFIRIYKGLDNFSFYKYIEK